MSEETIHIEQLRISTRIGVPESERAVPQELALNVTLWPNQSWRDLEDDISRTVDYSTVAHAIEEFVKNRRDKLIETLADQVAAHLLSSFPIKQVRIELRKFVLAKAEFVSVTLTRPHLGA
jgi:dihydroneopterin aldolase